MFPSLFLQTKAGRYERTDEWRKNHSKFMTGRKLTEEHKKKISQNNARYWLGKKSLIPENKHYAWKGDEVGYRTLHKWVTKHFGKATYCSNDLTHKASRFHWANISGEYKRDITDWHQLCPKCNFNDGIIIPIRFKQKRREIL